jgi:hypothetical protein
MQSHVVLDRDGRQMEVLISLVLTSHQAGIKKSETVIVPSRCCSSGMAVLLSRTLDDFASQPIKIDIPILEVPTHVSSRGLRLCIDYMEHYISEAEVAATRGESPVGVGRPESEASIANVIGDMDPTRLPEPPARASSYLPTVIPAPLDEPLENILSAWENTFIAGRLLGNNGDPWHHQDLVLALRASQYLELESLQALCLAWCANQMWKMCNSIKKPLEAAEMIRKFFGVANDWTPEEEECLRIENEWPEDEL